MEKFEGDRKSSKVLKVGQGGDLIMTAVPKEKSGTSTNNMCMVCRCNTRMADEEEA